MVEEEQKNHLSGEILREMQTEELAGNSQTLKEPGKSYHFKAYHIEKLLNLDTVVLFCFLNVLLVPGISKINIRKEA